MAKHHALAIRNVAHYGDTDIFPFPIENALFHDMPSEVEGVLEEMEKDWEKILREDPPTYVEELAILGYQGFRVATQIDPIWNAFLLSQVIAIAADLEASRLGREKVFAYRFSPSNDGRLFDERTGWHSYRESCEAAASKCQYVLVTDIADFYGRVYHHRIENALKAAAPGTHHPRAIMSMLMALRNNTSYGLPVGGAASRILAETALDRVDRLLDGKGYRFCRFVDDYTFFVESRSQAYELMHYLTALLSRNEGLTIQKSKTRVLSAKEYVGKVSAERLAIEGDDMDKQEQEFVMIRWRYDPYSASATADYENLRAHAQKFDVVGMLGREVKKSRLNPVLARKLVEAIRVLDGKVKLDAINSIMGSLESLYPVLHHVLVVGKALIDQENDADIRRAIVDGLLKGWADKPHLFLSAPVRGFLARILARDAGAESLRVLTSIHDESNSPVVRRDVIYAMTRRGNLPWLSDRLRVYHMEHAWEKRALVAASYALGDEGSHWRDKAKHSWDGMADLVAKWSSARKQAGKSELPV